MEMYEPTFPIKLQARNDADLNYYDAFCSGWNQHRSGYSRESVYRIQLNNNEWFKNQGNLELCNSGLADGWNARENQSMKFENKEC